MPERFLVDVYRWVFGDRAQPLLETVERWPPHCGLASWTALAYIVRVLAAARDVDWVGSRTVLLASR